MFLWSLNYTDGTALSERHSCSAMIFHATIFQCLLLRVYHFHRMVRVSHCSKYLKYINCIVHVKKILTGNFRAHCREIFRSIFSNACHGKTVDTILNCPHPWLCGQLKGNRQNFVVGRKVTIINPERIRVWDGLELQRYGGT